MKQNSRLNLALVIVLGLWFFRPWLTFVFGAEMADITLDAFHLHANGEQRRQYRIFVWQHTHGSFLSHLSLDDLHREHDRVNLRTLGIDPEQTSVMGSLSLLPWSFMAGGERLKQ